ncbi:MAG TPA: hypothetical protein VF597_03895 [Candidatus Saccharimonadales bacterium]|jgi:hypothetical protein
MQIIRFDKVDTLAKIDLQAPIFKGAIAEANRRGLREVECTEDLPVLEKFMRIKDMFYVGRDGWHSTSIRVTIRNGCSWSDVEPRLRRLIDSLPAAR